MSCEECLVHEGPLPCIYCRGQVVCDFCYELGASPLYDDEGVAIYNTCDTCRKEWDDAVAVEANPSSSSS